MPRMARPQAAPPPPPAGKDGASQRVSECNTPTGRWMRCISSLFLHKDLWHKLSGRSHFSFPFLGVAMVFIFSKCETWDYWHFGRSSWKWRQKKRHFCGLYWQMQSGTFSKTQRAPIEQTNKHTEEEEEEAFRLQRRDTYVLCCHWYISVGASVCPELTLRLSLPFCLKVSQRSPSLTSDQSQKSLESLFSARWVLKLWQTEFSLDFSAAFPISWFWLFKRSWGQCKRWRQPWLWNDGFYPYDLREHQRSHLHKN